MNYCDDEVFNDVLRDDEIKFTVTYLNPEILKRTKEYIEKLTQEEKEMNYKVNGQFETLIVLSEQDRELFDTVRRHGVDKLHAELEASYTMTGVYSNVLVELEEMFDEGIDDWHGSIRVSADVKAIVTARSKERALSVMQNHYADNFSDEVAYLFAGNGDMIQLDSVITNTNIDWKDSVAHFGKVDEYSLIYSANHAY